MGATLGAQLMCLFLFPAGKAAAAGVLLPLAVGIEMIAVPGTGWYVDDCKRTELGVDHVFLGWGVEGAC
jgi:hypothetical protein